MGKQQDKRRRGAGQGRGEDRTIKVHGVRRDPPGIKKFSRALVALAVAQAEAEAKAAHESRFDSPDSTSPPKTAISNNEDAGDAR